MENTPLRPVLQLPLHPGRLMFRGILSVIFGVLALAWPGPSLLAIAILYGAYAFADGIMALSAGIRRGVHHQRSWGLPILEGILGVAAGVITAFWPGITLFVLSILVGAWALSTGVLEIMAAFNLRRFLPEASNIGKILLGGVGLFSIALGVSIFAIPALGAITMLSMVASYALVSGALFIGLAAHLRRQERAYARRLEERKEEAPEGTKKAA